MNEHNKNFHIMEELLATREDLICKYFTNPFLSDNDYFIMHHEFNTTQRPVGYEKTIVLDSLSSASPSKLNFQCCFNSAQISLITSCVNEVHLFSSNVSEEEMKALFSCCLDDPLKSACNRRVAFFFDFLCANKLISSRWQKVIDSNRLILSSAKNTPLNSSKLSTALNEVKRTYGCIYRTIELKVLKIVKEGGFCRSNMK